jgi:hypothetical protein
MVELRICPNGIMMDGKHRLKAARFKVLNEFECRFQDYPEK